MNLRPLLPAAIILSATLASAAIARQQEAPKPLLQPAPGLSAVDPQLNDTLDRIEAADKTLTNLTAPIRLIRRFPAIQGGGEHTRYGTIFYETKSSGAGQPPLRKFSLKFETLDVRAAEGQEAARREDKQSFTFDGTWLLETREDGKFFVKRRIVAPGVIKDPVRIGEGPFPLPVGQRKMDMLERFNITIVQPLDQAPEKPDALRALLSKCIQLRLVPKVDTPGARDFREIRLWYRATDLMPIFAKTVNLDDSSSEVFLILKDGWDKPVSPAVFSTTPPPAEEGWKGDIIEQVPGNAAPTTTK